ncbi:MAG: DMT family transporter, partial [Marinobacter sp.]|uniref:DMT family transporter n=1 Tax=Marinobacter sp. TaxID=50741 RepID=UPI00299DBF51
MAIMSTAFVALAAFCWGLSGGIGAVLIAGGWDAYVVALYRGGIGLVFVLVWLLLSHRNSGLAVPRLWLWAALAGVGVAGNFTFYFISIEQGSIPVAATLMYCAPVFVYLVSFAIGLERFTLVKGLALILVLLGIVLLTRVYDVGAASVTGLGVAAGLLAGASYALFIFGFKFAARHGSPQAILTIAFAALVTALLGLSEPAQVAAVPYSPDLPMFAALGVLG